ncbi:MAG TPA: UDP-N-acetylmuramoyl-L-alanyl-D-glutamate--2,6-diaminopimelate ligase [Flavobacteriaceae bacterium]|nr:UDP-N-acetylmuramoyl-L-alanyl-D-glutamate--2,6-diaminopimelate ligase [Flavobacteriaceae bacterium]
MKQLKDILYKVRIEKVKGKTDRSIKEVVFDSRKIAANTLFVAIRGSATDGHQYIEQAVQAGAVAVVCEELPETLSEKVTYVNVLDSKEALAVLAANYFENPSENLKLVGVTGTNGKTTVTTLLHEMFSNAGYKVGLISTVNIKIGNQEFATRLTTPDSITINSYLKKMNEAGVEYCFMEVSSHGIHQKRTAGLAFAGGVFTNLSQDHLDYHKDFAEYRNTKKKFFDQLPKNAFALTNRDDKNGLFMLQNTKAHKKTYALKSAADYTAKILEGSFQGMLMVINQQEVWTKLIGDFNAYNLLAIYASADLLKMDTVENLKTLSNLDAVEGRFEHFISAQKEITAIVDYAHTPDALENVLKTINKIRPKNESLITVVGCGGDRDKNKRPLMGRIAAQLSDKVIYTSDNPRTEDPEQIIKDVEAGVEPQNTHKTLAIVNRRQAIKTACVMAEEKDIILIAGKGHESYQEIHGERHHFDDMELVTEFLISLKK